MSERLALVLAGGGIAGIAWETGFLFGIQDHVPSAADGLVHADILLGTSAGSTVAAQISSRVTLDELYSRHLAETTYEIAPGVEIDDLMWLFEPVSDAPMTEQLRAIGRRALAAPTVAEAVRRRVIEQRLPSHRWPEDALRVTAIDVDTGERVVFDRESGVSLVDAVAASCAVPAVWPPVTIGQRRYMDGGVGSSANLDVVHDADAVVMLAPTAEPGASPFGPTLADEAAGHPGRVLGIFADDESLAAFGRNPLDPSCRGPSARAGRRQGRYQASSVAEFLASGPV
jgi:NTE family protein